MCDIRILDRTEACLPCNALQSGTARGAEPMDW